MPKNYIHRLQDENREKQERLDEIERRLREFQVHLASSKFTGTETDGSRRDWIATGDVTHRIREILASEPIGWDSCETCPSHSEVHCNECEIPARTA